MTFSSLTSALGRFRALRSPYAKIEAISFYHYLRTTQLITLRQIQERFRTEPTRERDFYTKDSRDDQEAAHLRPYETAPEPQVPVALHVPTHRFLLGLSDLTGELMRFATNAVGQGDTGTVVTQVLGITRQLRDALDPFVPLVHDLRKKQTVTNQSLRKIEDSKLCRPSPISLSPRSALFGHHIHCGCPLCLIATVLYAIRVRSAEFGSDPQALKEMVRRTLASTSSAPDPPNDDE